jgi:uncharacterized protein YecE (DUF72 family)
VELNYTFYRMPNAKTVAGWKTAVPDGFTFVRKAPQRITPFARLRNVADPLRYFTDTTRPLGTKFGPVLVQLPPQLQAGSGPAQGLPAALSSRLALRIRISPAHGIDLLGERAATGDITSDLVAQ